MNVIQRFYDAQVIAELAATQMRAVDFGIVISVECEDDDVFFVAWAIASGTKESIRLLCSATSLDRLTMCAATLKQGVYA